MFPTPYFCREYFAPTYFPRNGDNIISNICGTLSLINKVDATLSQEDKVSASLSQAVKVTSEISIFNPQDC